MNRAILPKHDKFYAVYLCGPTDCFLHAIFVEERRAEAWAETVMNVEGYIVKEISFDDIPLVLKESEE
jgi:hypothetical protein